MFGQPNRQDFGIFRQLHVEDNEDNGASGQLKKQWDKRYKSLSDYTESNDISRTQYYAIFSANPNPKFGTVKKIAKSLNIPVWVIAGIIAKEIKLDGEEAIILKTQARIKY